MDNLEQAGRLVKAYEATFENPRQVTSKTKLYTGVDLGTAYLVLAVVDEEGRPIAGAKRYAAVVKDGLVVDYLGAVKIVRELKEDLEKKLGRELEAAGVAYPPGTPPGDRRTIQYVAEAVGLEVTTVVDEPTAANEVLGIRDGAVVDVGGGTTGMAILKDGRVIYSADEPTGGTHFSLVIAGAYQVAYEEAEKMKTSAGRQKELLPVVLPVMQKVAAIIGRHIRNYRVDTIYLAGGTCCFRYMEKILEKELGVPVVKPENPFLVTPLGIALSAAKHLSGTN